MGIPTSLQPKPEAVVKGCRRDSKLLEIPTANMAKREIGRVIAQNTPTDIYFGYAMLCSTVYPSNNGLGELKPVPRQPGKMSFAPNLLRKFEEQLNGKKLHMELIGSVGLSSTSARSISYRGYRRLLGMQMFLLRHYCGIDKRS